MYEYRLSNILIKASAGGGGIGMQIVNNFNELKSAVDKTKKSCQKSFWK